MLLCWPSQVLVKNIKSKLYLLIRSLIKNDLPNKELAFSSPIKFIASFIFTIIKWERVLWYWQFFSHCNLKHQTSIYWVLAAKHAVRWSDMASKPGPRTHQLLIKAAQVTVLFWAWRRWWLLWFLYKGDRFRDFLDSKCNGEDRSLGRNGKIGERAEVGRGVNETQVVNFRWEGIH